VVDISAIIYLCYNVSIKYWHKIYEIKEEMITVLKAWLLF